MPLSLDFKEKDAESEYLREIDDYDIDFYTDLSICDEEDEEMWNTNGTHMEKLFVPCNISSKDSFARRFHKDL
ncbi:hypothetical protein TNCV_2287971 [Trichonephila clavipes]|nr:hypothetical protein TNCV_2287971 [Trichonephila clavipes]